MALFNKNDAGSQELENLTGQWYASSPYRLIATEINFATNEVAKLTGKEVMTAAQTAYDDDAEPELVTAVRLPVACLALMRHAQLSSVSHEATGRKVKVDDNEKSAFEWQIDRDDRAMMERYYRALDAMYSYLDGAELDVWVTSPKKAMLSESIVTDITQFEAVYPIDGSYYVYYMLQSLVIERQKALIEPFTGSSWEQIVAGTADKAVLALARRAAILSAVITAGKRWSLEVFPLEIARRFSTTYQGNKSNKAASADEIDWYIGNLESDMNEALDDLAAAITAEADRVDPKLIPENDPHNKYFTTE